jgi:hypothetical protein
MSACIKAIYSSVQKKFKAIYTGDIMSAFEDLIPESLSLAQQHIPITTLHTHL